MTDTSKSSPRFAIRTDSGIVLDVVNSARRYGIPGKNWYHGRPIGFDDMDMIKLSVPGTLLFSRCRSASPLPVPASALNADGKQEPGREAHDCDDKGGAVERAKPSIMWQFMPTVARRRAQWISNSRFMSNGRSQL